jgi:hypothetical protein
MQGAPQEFLQFLRRLDREFPLDLALHLTMDNLLVGIDCFAVLVGAFAAAMNRDFRLFPFTLLDVLQCFR